eukprot:12976411-Alexandrium_andersonii.AAC.1
MSLYVRHVRGPMCAVQCLDLHVSIAVPVAGPQLALVFCRLSAHFRGGRLGMTRPVANVNQQTYNSVARSVQRLRA